MKMRRAIQRSRANSEYFAMSREIKESGQNLSFTNQDEQDTLLIPNNNEVKNGNNKS
tara:strand:- start:492 stop:662 length:171 start_codon:yes stop_codon:yes gene_type:complete